MPKISNLIENGLHATEKVLASPLFYIFSIWLGNMVAIAYNIIAVAFTLSYSDHLAESLIGLGYFLNWALVSILFVLMIEISSNIANKVKSLNNALMKMNIEDKSYLLCNNGRFQCAQQSRAELYHLLSDFQGLTGNGFFVLNRPCLSSIISSFLTYIIILVQFRITEMSK